MWTSTGLTLRLACSNSILADKAVSVEVESRCSSCRLHHWHHYSPSHFVSACPDTRPNQLSAECWAAPSVAPAGPQKRTSIMCGEAFQQSTGSFHDNALNSTTKPFPSTKYITLVKSLRPHVYSLVLTSSAASLVSGEIIHRSVPDAKKCRIIAVCRRGIACNRTPTERHRQHVAGGLEVGKWPDDPPASCKINQVSERAIPPILSHQWTPVITCPVSHPKPPTTQVLPRAYDPPQLALAPRSETAPSSYSIKCSLQYLPAQVRT